MIQKYLDFIFKNHQNKEELQQILFFRGSIMNEPRLNE